MPFDAVCLSNGTEIANWLFWQTNTHGTLCTAAKVSAAKAHAAEVGAGQIGAAKVAALEVLIAQVLAAEIDHLKTCTRLSRGRLLAFQQS